MKDENLEVIVKNFIAIMPLFQKKLIRKDCRFTNEPLNPSHFQIMATLKEQGKSPISDISKKLFISAPNMTKLLNKLIEENMVERSLDAKDRRIINISLTKNGDDYLLKKFEQMNDSIKDRLSTLSDKQLEKLSNSLEDLKSVLTEISSDE